MKRLVLESTAPFQGLPELVAYDEGLFEKEGLDIEWVDRDAGAEKKKTVVDVTSPRGLNPFTSHGRLFEQGQADMLVAARNPTPPEKVQLDLSECQAAARTAWNSDAAARDRTFLAAQGPAYNPGAEVSKATMDLLAKTYETCLQPKGYTASAPVPK